MRSLLLIAALVLAAAAAPTPRDIHTNANATNRNLLDFIDFVLSQCSDVNQCSFVDTLTQKNDDRWLIADGWANGVPFDSWWSKDRVTFDAARSKMKISVGREANLGKPYVSGHMQSNNKWHGYGCYEVRMKPPNQEGLITTFFSYTGKFDHAPGHAKLHNEVDVEFVYKRRLKRVSLQANYFTNGKGGNEKIIPLSFNPTRRLHNYAFKWTSKGIEWYVDGKKVYSATKNTPKISNGPHKIMMNLWPVSASASRWGGNYVWRGKKTATYSGVRFTRGEDCKIVNKF